MIPDSLPDVIGGHWLAFSLPAADVAKGYNAWCTRCGDLFRNWQEAETFACIPQEDEEEESIFIECQQCKEVYAASHSDDCPHHPDDPDEEDFPDEH
jgi:hypothetical protein